MTGSSDIEPSKAEVCRIALDVLRTAGDAAG
jgi:hypothetical protein